MVNESSHCSRETPGEMTVLPKPHLTISLKAALSTHGPTTSPQYSTRFCGHEQRTVQRTQKEITISIPLLLQYLQGSEQSFQDLVNTVDLGHKVLAEQTCAKPVKLSL